VDRLPEGEPIRHRDSIWARVQEFGWTLNGNISLGDEWSSVRAKRV